MTTSSKRKPSQSNANDIKNKANEANRKRRERVARKKMERAIYDSEVESSWTEANAMNDEWNKANKKEAPKKPFSNKPIKVICDGLGYESLNAALRAAEPEEWAKEGDYRRSCWTKINRNLKKTGSFEIKGHIFELNV